MLFYLEILLLLPCSREEAALLGHLTRTWFAFRFNNKDLHILSAGELFCGRLLYISHFLLVPVILQNVRLSAILIVPESMDAVWLPAVADNQTTHGNVHDAGKLSVRAIRNYPLISRCLWVWPVNSNA